MTIYTMQPRVIIPLNKTFHDRSLISSVFVLSFDVNSLEIRIAFKYVNCKNLLI